MSPHLLSGAARLAGSSLLRLQSDDRLVALVRDGHDPAFAMLVERYGGELRRYCGRLVGDGRAEDVVQQAFLNAHTALMASENDIQLRPWLYRIAHNAALNTLRAARRQSELDDRVAAPRGVEEDVETRERLHEALAAIARLPEPQRDALMLRAIEGRNHHEIAAALGVTPGAARQHVHRARATVRGAVSAITPYGLMARFAIAGDDPASAGLLGGLGAGATGAGAAAAKLGAGVLAAGAIATGTTGHLPFTDRHEAPRAAVAARSAHPPPVPAGPTARTSPGSEHARDRPAPARSHRGGPAGDRRRGHGPSSSGRPAHEDGPRHHADNGAVRPEDRSHEGGSTEPGGDRSGHEPSPEPAETASTGDDGTATLPSTSGEPVEDRSSGSGPDPLEPASSGGDGLSGGTSGEG